MAHAQQALPFQGPPPVQVSVAGPVPQSRLTILFRALMAIPHMIVLWFLAIAAEVVAFLGWWGALFTGRLPEFAVSYLTGYMRWSTRVQAYLLLLTGTYPPFTLDDVPDYPVRLATTRERLSRPAVFFRFILVIPAMILASILASGALTIVAFAAWIIALITGKLPAALHLAYTAVFRYQARLNCYIFLLTPTYPVRGLLGDESPGPAPEPGNPATWRLALTPAARRLVIAFIILGVLIPFVGMSGHN